MLSWNSYPSIFHVGHRSVADLFATEVDIEEKVDGSQFSFGVNEDGEIKVRSKVAVLYADAPEKMFARAMETVKGLVGRLHPGWTYRGEYLQKAKHNTLAYSRVPESHIILFDIATGLETYMLYEEKAEEAARIGLEVVPRMFSGKINSAAEIRQFLEANSVLGGQKVEGVVIKPVGHSVFGIDKKPLLGKFVSEAFKEIHGGEWRKNNPVAKDIVEELASKYRTPARWRKAIIHLAEKGLIENSPRDIGKLLMEVKSDVLADSESEIKEALFKWAWPHIQRSLTHGLPEWYKQELLDSAFTADETTPLT